MKTRYCHGFQRFYSQIRQVNNVSDLSKISFLNSTALNTGGATTLTSQKTGTAYKGYLNNGFGWDVFFEFYTDIWKHQAIPGLYLKPTYSYGSTRLTKSKLAVDLGIIWNLSNSDKTKNVISIVPFVSWSNFLRDYTDPTKNTTHTLAELFSVGVKFGIPINIGN